MFTHTRSFARHLVAGLRELVECALVGAFEAAEATAHTERDRRAVRRFRRYVFDGNADMPFYPADARLFFALLHAARSRRWACSDCHVN